MSLRARKKDKTRADLLASALRLFESQGFAETTLHQIADAVDVSSRTLLRYFPTKEDIVVSWVEEGMSVLLTALESRPAGESPRAALLASARAMLAHYQGQAEFYLTIERTIAATPAIQARKLEMSARLAEQVTAILAARGGDAGWQLELLPEIVFATLRVVIARWVRDGGRQPLPELFDQAVQLLADPPR